MIKNLSTLFTCILMLGVLLAVPSRAQDAAAHGTITGTIFDANNGQPIRGATVSLRDDPSVTTLTGLDGQYTLSVPAGTHAISVRAENYIETDVTAIEVVAGQYVDASTVMAAKGAVTTVDVVEKVGAVAATSEALTTERKLAAVVSDGISGEEIKNSTASDAAGALEKVTGVSVVEGGYVYVRGLGERYSATMLNNAMIPSTDPERRVVPLDLFPASLIDSIKVLKTYTPDLPGEFSGGLVQLETVEFPSSPTLRFGLSYGFNTRTTFKEFNTYGGGGRDFFGFDDGTRDVPGLVPSNDRLVPGKFSADQLQQFGRSFPDNWQPIQRTSERPAQSYTISGGNTWGRLGLVGAVTFSNTPQRYQELRRFLSNAGGGQPVIITDYPDYVADAESARLGAVINAAVQLAPSHKLVVRNTLTHDTDKEARVLRGLNGTLDSDIQDERLRWVERGLWSTSLEGEHLLPGFGNSLLSWQLTYSKSNRNEPDLREVVRAIGEDGKLSYLASSFSGTRFYNKFDDHIYEPLVEFGKPFFTGNISGIFKVGFRATLRDRDFEARRFRFVPVRLSQIDLTAPSDVLFGPDNITPNLFEIRENTRGTDSYTGDMNVYAGFAMADLVLSPRWRLVGGIRLEDADIRVTTIDPLVPGAVPQVAELKNRDPLPGINVIYSVTPQQNIRFGYGRTLSRPDFRELSPFDFTNVLGGFTFAGNPNLLRAKIDNFDARWEWFFGGNQLFAVSYFYKDFTDPIETTVQPTTGDLRESFINAEGAHNQGVEVEFRRSLQFLHPKLSTFAVQTNFTFVDSEVQLGNDQMGLLTSLVRPLTGQSRYIYNIVAEWAQPRWRSNARFYTNYVSRRITDVGALGLADIYQEPSTFLDFVYQFDVKEGGKWSIRFTAENLTDNHYRWTQADVLQRSYRLGRTFSVGTSFGIF